MTYKTKLLIGAHMSIEGGLEKALERGASIGCSAIQIFTSSNRQWHIKTLTPDSIEKFNQAQKKYDVFVVTHASYLINLGSENTDTIDKSISTLKKQLEYCDILKIPYLILHPGSGKPLSNTIERIGTNLNNILKEYSGKTMVLLELMAGQGSSVAYTFEQLAEIKKYIKMPIGFCIDTCHAWQAGYNLAEETSYNKIWEDFDKKLGLKNLKVFHINGSKKDLGERVDRHADLDEGTMGLEPFRLIMNDKRFLDIPKILETPADSLEDYKRNMDILEKLITPETKKLLNL